MKIEVLPVAAFSISCIIGVCKISFFLVKINQFQITMLLFMQGIASQNAAGGGVRGNEGQILVLQGEG